MYAYSNVVKKHTLINSTFFPVWPITQRARSNLYRSGSFANISQEWNLIGLHRCSVYCLRMLSKSVFVLKSFVISTNKAYPILKALVPLEQMLSPGFLCGEEDFGVYAIWQYTRVWTKVIRNVFSDLLALFGILSKLDSLPPVTFR